MGYGKWSSHAYANMQSRYRGKGRDEIFTANKFQRMDPALDPFRLRFRESRDSEEHPESLAIGLFLDVTGSMGKIPEDLVRNQLGSLMDTMLQLGVKSPQLMFSAVGDHRCDRAPLQVGQFESSTTSINDGLSRLFLEGGGGDAPESYLMAWQIAARHSSIDCWEKRRQKGFLFTVGDDITHNSFEASHQMRLLGYEQATDLSARQLLAEAQEQYEVFHIHVNQTGSRNSERVLNHWRELLGQRLLVLDDYQQLGALIATIVAVMSGASTETAMRHHDDATRQTLSRSLDKYLV